ncbi:subclass B3 metallo-beta-lactamase [Gemmatimonas aurantiaca]|uniref:subclass B3 metallo-beta-lactamase n=1 Tax=Gemmatimonas aurantiaca TaxID=173480 RepID=UPI00301D002D
MFALTAALASTIVAGVARAQGGAPAQVPAGVRALPPTPNCPDCAEWNAPHAPFRIFGNSYYVGTNGLAAILVTSTDGHVLIDGALPESAPQIIANIAAMGFRVSDIRIIVNSHAHFDHAGSIAELQRLSGATVAASAPSARWLQAGQSGPDDPQYGMNPGFTPVPRVRVLRDGEVVKLGSLALTAHFTGGHTPGGTSWSWQSCEAARCLDLVYADSQTPISADDFFYTRSSRYRTGVADFRRGQALLERLSCDILITPHPSASSLWERLAGTGRGEASAERAQSPASLVDREACRRYAARGRASLEQRIAREARPRATTPSR